MPYCCSCVADGPELLNTVFVSIPFTSSCRFVQLIVAEGLSRQSTWGGNERLKLSTQLRGHFEGFTARRTSRSCTRWRYCFESG